MRLCAPVPALEWAEGAPFTLAKWAPPPNAHAWPFPCACLGPFRGSALALSLGPAVATPSRSRQGGPQYRDAALACLHHVLTLSVVLGLRTLAAHDVALPRDAPSDAYLAPVCMRLCAWVVLLCMSVCVYVFMCECCMLCIVCMGGTALHVCMCVCVHVRMLYVCMLCMLCMLCMEKYVYECMCACVQVCVHVCCMVCTHARACFAVHFVTSCYRRSCVCVCNGVLLSGVLQVVGPALHSHAFVERVYDGVGVLTAGSAAGAVYADSAVWAWVDREQGAQQSAASAEASSDYMHTGTRLR